MIIDELDDVLEMSSDFLHTIQKQHLFERILFDGNNAKIKIDKSLIELFKDIYGTSSTLKKLYLQVENHRNLSETNLKFFRLVRNNAKELIDYLTRVFNSSMTKDKLGGLFDKGFAILTKFIHAVNNILTEIQTKLHPKDKGQLDPIKSVLKPNVVKATPSPVFRPEFQGWMNDQRRIT